MAKCYPIALLLTAYTSRTKNHETPSRKKI
jgi:hypothetical protein